MRRFILKVLFFTLPLMAFLLAAELLLRNIPNAYSTKLENFVKKKGEIETLVLGSSHNLRAVNPHILGDNSYSMAMVAQPLQIDKRILKEHVKEMPRLKTVVLSISYFSLSKEMTDGETFNRLPFYHFFYDMDFPELAFTSSKRYSLLATTNLRDALSKIHKYYVKRKAGVVADELGWMGAGGTKLLTSQFPRDARSAFKRHEDGSTDFKKNLNELKDIISLSKEFGFRIIFVNTPKSPDYNHLLNREKQGLIDAEIQKLVKSQSNILYLNLQDDPSFSLADFRNSDHLNNSGAEKFSRLLHGYLVTGNFD